MPSLGEGFANSLNESLKQQQTGKLELALLSRRMEMESNMRMAEMQKQHELSMVPGEQIGSLLKAVDKGDISGLSGQSFPEHLGQAALSAMGQKERATGMLNQPKHIFEKPDINGVITGHWVVPITGQEVGTASTTLEPHRVDAINKADTAYASMHSTFERVRNMMGKVLSEHPEAAGVPIQRLNGWLQEHGFPTDPVVKTFIDTMPQVGLTMAKMQDGTVRGWEMAKTDIATLPNLTDTLQSGTMKLNQADQLVKDKASATHVIYDPSNFLKSPLHYKAQGAQEAVDNTKAGDPEKFLRNAVQARLQREALVQSQAKPNGSKQQ